MTISKENTRFLRRITALSIPIILQETLNSLVNLIDNFMVGSLGLESVTAVGLANLVFFLYAVVVFGVCSGSAIYIGQFWGKKDIKSIHKSMGLAWISGLSLSMAVSIGVIIAAPRIMKFYSHGDEQVISLGIDYLRAVIPVYPLFVCITVINSSLRSIGMTKIPLFSTVVGLSCNVVFNSLFIFVLDMGVVGAAYGTVIARSIEHCVQLILIKYMGIPILGPVRNYLAFDFEFIKSYYVLITPVVLNEFFWALGTMMYFVLYKTTGTEGQGAAQIGATIQNLFIVMGMGIGNGCGIMIANALGAGERERAISYSRKSLVMSAAASVVMSLLLLLLSPFLIGIYNVPDSVKALAFKICVVCASGMVIKNLNFTNIIGILRSGGDTRFCLLIDGVTVWLVALPLIVCGAYIYQLPVYALVALTYSEEVVKLVFSLKRVFGDRWARNLVEDM